MAKITTIANGIYRYENGRSAPAPGFTGHHKLIPWILENFGPVFSRPMLYDHPDLAISTVKTYLTYLKNEGLVTKTKCPENATKAQRRHGWWVIADPSIVVKWRMNIKRAENA